jgi:regulatory protein
LRYVERYATTRSKLATYLKRKLRERGWNDENPPTIDALIGKLADLRYVDDASYASQRTAGLTRRGYGARRVVASLKAAGIGQEDAFAAETNAREQAWETALAFARRKRIGPFASTKVDRGAREKAFAALLRAGHDVAIARRIVQSEPGSVPEID